MDTYTADLLRKFDRAIKKERIMDLQINPYVTAMIETGESIDHPDTQRAIIEHTKSYITLNKSNAYIFGDTYGGMPLSEATAIMLKQEFRRDKILDNHHIGVTSFSHEYHDITGCISSSDGKTANGIELFARIYIGHGEVPIQTFNGLGVLEHTITNGYLNSHISATGGLEIKMAVLRRLAATPHTEDSTA